MQAYTLIGQTNAPSGEFGTAMATLTFARQLGGSLGAAAFGWILLTLTDTSIALTAIFLAAAALLLTAFIAAPQLKNAANTRPGNS